MQIVNLLYSTLFTSIAHLPHFIPLFLMAGAFVVLFGGVALLLATKKSLYLIPANFYVAIALFVLATDVLARMGIQYTFAIYFVVLLVLIFALAGYFRNKNVVLSWFKSFRKEKIKYLFIFAVILVSTFFFSKFIYDNGLHDEYQHHAAVEDMLQTGQWPIRDEIRYGIDLSDFYHYGWYYLVLLVTSVFPVSIEVALDLVKLMLFIPMLPLFYALIEKFFQTKWYESLLLSATLLVQGPALFFFDAYTGNVLFSQGNEIIYEPLFFQLAGVTWFGIVVLVSLLAIAQSLLAQQKKLILLFMYIVIFCWSLFLLNKAYLLVFIPAIILLYIYFRRDHIFNLIKNKKLLYIVVFGMIFLVVISNYFSPMFFTLFRGDSGIPFVRPFNKIGFPYSGHEGLSFISPLTIQSVRAFGLIPLLSFHFVFKKDQSNKFKRLLIVLLLIYLWMVPVFLNFSGSELVLNKLFIPALWVSTLVVAHSALKQSKQLQYLIFGLILSSVIAPILYFASISLPGSHVYWGKSDAIISSLPQDRVLYIFMNSSDAEYAKQIMNSARVQLIYKESQLDDIDTYYEITTNEIFNEEPLAQTDTHYLYAK